MAYRKIDYLEWARTYMGHVRYDLARSNVKDLPRDELAITADDVDFSTQYPQGHPELLDLLAKRYGTTPERIHIVNGASAGITLACAATMLPGDEVLMESPNYEPLYRAAVHSGAS